MEMLLTGILIGVGLKTQPKRTCFELDDRPLHLADALEHLANPLGVRPSKQQVILHVP